MRTIHHVLFVCALMLSLLGAVPSGWAKTKPSKASSLPPTERQWLQWAAKGDMAALAPGLTRYPEGTLMGDTLRWIAVVQHQVPLPLPTLEKLVVRRSDWPDKDKILASIERQMLLQYPQIPKAWWKKHPPVSSAGRMVEALQRASVDPAARDQLRQQWIHGEWNSSEEKRILASAKDWLRPEDHHQRFDHLLCHMSSKREKEMQRLLPLLPRQRQALWNAHRDTISGKHQPSLGNNSHPCLLAAAAHYALHHDNVEKATGWMEHLHAHHRDHPPHWWSLKHRYAREMLALGRPLQAYRAAASHGHSGGIDFDEAEWLAGWIALRYLHDPQTAVKHFEHLHAHVKSAPSRARAAYWVGRAYRAMSNHEEAISWWKRAGRAVDHFYGQLALEALGQKQLHLPRVVPKPEDREIIKQSSLLKVADLFYRHGLLAEGRRFAKQAIMLYEGDGQRHTIASLPTRYGLTHEAVLLAKEAGYRGTFLPDLSFPVIETRHIPMPEGLDPALVLGVIRQETHFDSKASSSAGALGLMQLLPAVAKETAQKIGLAFRKEDVWRRDTNVRLGAAHLESYFRRRDGSLVLGLAGYNAGPRRVDGWIARFGDPRRMDAEGIIDWIELISFRETRNYVQKVLANHQIYRARLAQQKTELTLQPLLQSGLPMLSANQGGAGV
jgi:soluble lytic murein transglycosylase